MTKQEVEHQIQKLREQWKNTPDEVSRKVIAIRGKLFKRALQIMENKEPAQKELLQ